MSMLARRQRWLYHAITAERAPSTCASVLGGTSVAPDIGVAVYRHAYRARLREALADDFTAVARVVGEDTFTRLVDGFIRVHPPRDATLNAYGRLFPSWLKRTRLARRAALSELAALEWALVEAVHAPTAPAVAATALAAIAPTAWGRVRLRAAPSLRVVECRHAIDVVLEAVRQEHTPPPFRRRAGGVAVLRRADGLRRITLDAWETRVLTALLAGKTLGTALARVPATHLPDLRDAFTRWVAQGFFTAIA